MTRAAQDEPCFSSSAIERKRLHTIGHPEGMADRISGHADSSNSCPTWATAVGDLRGHAVGWAVGAGLIACADVVIAKTKPATAINLIIRIVPSWPYQDQKWSRPLGSEDRWGNRDRPSDEERLQRMPYQIQCWRSVKT